MKNYRVLTLFGGILLMVGAALPWATLTSSFLGFSRTLSGLEGDGIISAIGGLILLIVALAAKGKPGNIYSVFGLIVAILCGLLLVIKIVGLSGTSIDPSVDMSLGFGLTCVSPLGVLLAFIGSVIRVPAIPEPTQPEGPAAPVA
jgi:hypothetical protein